MADPMKKSLPLEVVEAWRSGRKVEAIRLLRESTGAGLAEAKAALEALKLLYEPPPTGGAAAKMEAPHGDAATREAMKAAGAKLSSLGLNHEALSPGEVPRAQGGPWLFVVLALVLLAVWAASKLT
jgi:hypothetical protein